MTIEALTEALAEYIGITVPIHEGVALLDKATLGLLVSILDEQSMLSHD